MVCSANSTPLELCRQIQNIPRPRYQNRRIAKKLPRRPSMTALSFISRQRKNSLQLDYFFFGGGGGPSLS
jgi:hypothetical protein